ncbi:efflux RND transporter periplasmic adaptor subunit [Thalassolituus sp. LLYu03]|uniref:efflux RND transporter periplasmic adaptor subunit n=1 Tax=Thalassolituus sp. LLYu03 TaxID=3421656 RepID=UPI003D289444
MNQNEQQKAEQLGLVSAPKSRKKLWLATSAALVLIVAGATWALIPGDDHNNQVFKTDAVTRGNLAVTVTATGSVEPKDEVEVSSELSGIMAEVLVDYNDHVKKGQALARLDTTTLKASVLEKKSSLKSANASVAQANASLEEAKLDYAHYQKVWDLSGGKHPSQQTLDSARIAVTKAEAAVLVAEASVEKAQADLDSAETDLVKATLVSPIDGIVLSKDVEPGQTIASSYSAPTLFLLAADLKDMELHVDIDEADIALIKTGQKASFSVDAWSNRKFSAEITQIRLASTDDDSSSSSVVSYETILKVDNDDLALLPSMTAVTDIAVKSAEDVLTIASAALRYKPEIPGDGNAPAERAGKPGGIFSGLMPGPRRQGQKKNATEDTNVNGSLEGRKATIWVLRDNRPQPVEVRTGISDGLRTEIVSGELQEGDQVIIDAVKVNA